MGDLQDLDLDTHGDTARRMRVAVLAFDENLDLEALVQAAKRARETA